MSRTFKPIDVGTYVYPNPADMTFALPALEAVPEPEDEYTGSWAGLRWFLDFQWLK